jgi:hypothetical protein
MNFEYKSHDDSFIVNCGHPDGTDPDLSLKPIRISLPEPPDIKLIDGYELDPNDQYWRKPKFPSRLEYIERQTRKDLESNLKKNETLTGYKVLEAIWKKISNDPQLYKEEIEFIKKQWWHRIYGYWFFINGKPTYICGWHYMYLCYWKIEGRIYPEYRDRDRKNFLFWWYIFNTKEAFKNYDDKGYAIPNENGEYEMVEMPSKTFFGVVQPKNRRGGTTNMAECAMFVETSMSIGAIAAIFSRTKDSTESLFTNKMVLSWQNMPFFFLPVWDGYFKQSDSIQFKMPKNIVYGDQLNSIITYAKSAFGKEFDQERLTFAIFDESGKTDECDVTERWSTHKQGMSISNGAEIVGYAIHPSTVEDMDHDNGKNYQDLIYSSDFYHRIPLTGQTKSGLANTFFPGYEGMERFIGRFGESIIDTPTKEQISNGCQFKHGSKKNLQSSRDELLKSKVPKDKIEYRRLVVKFPFTLDECFKLTVDGQGWDMEIIDKRLAELRNMNEPFVPGNLKWKGKKFESDVYFEYDVNGKFELSMVLSPEMANRKVLTTVIDHITGDYKDCWMPAKPQSGTIGADAFKFKGDRGLITNTGSTQSDGGIAALLERDFRIDPEDKSIYEWETRRFVAAYRNRPLSNEYNEDVLMLAVYLGFMVYPETNAGTLWEFFLDHNYDGYLLFDIDPVTGKYKTRPGVYQLEKSKEEMWTEFQNFIAYRGHKEKHASILIEIAKLKRFEDLTQLDLAAAAGCALLGSKSRSRQLMEDVNDVKSDFEWWKNMLILIIILVLFNI